MSELHRTRRRRRRRRPWCRYHPPFPFVRYCSTPSASASSRGSCLHILFVLAVVQFAMHAINGRPNEELKSFSNTLLQYEWELLAYITFVRDEQPFPIGTVSENTRDVSCW